MTGEQLAELLISEIDYAWGDALQGGFDPFPYSTLKKGVWVNNENTKRGLAKHKQRVLYILQDVKLGQEWFKL